MAAISARVALSGAAVAQAKAPRSTVARSTVRVVAAETQTKFKSGVVTGKEFIAILDHAKANEYAIPAVNCTMSPISNACMEAAKKANAPMIVQFSNGGGYYNIGKGVPNDKEQKAAVAGTIAGALHVRAIAEFYGVPIILHTDHCAKKLLPWFDGLIEANEDYFNKYGEPLFTSHMLDLSEETMEENLEICAKYLKKMAAIDCFLEMEIGITGGEEDGVDNTDVAQEDLYSKPEEIWQVYEALSKVPGGEFTVAAAFGNVHGVYSPGNVKLDPEILGKAQKYIAEKLDGKAGDKPVKFVFHGGSGSDIKDIKQAIDYGVIKMNIDTDTQWSYWSGIKTFEAKFHDYLQSQIGNPEGADKPNKKYYDPRACMREAENSTVKRLAQCFEDLNCVNVLGLGKPEVPTNVLGPRRGSLPA